MISAAMDRTRRLRGFLLALLGALALCAAAPALAAAITVSNVSAHPTNGRAGANSDFSIGFDLSGGEVKDLVIHLPPGLVGNPLATTTCREAQLRADNCPAASKVGNISNAALLLNFVPITATGNVYNVVPRAGEPARFGFVLKSPGNLTAPIILQSPASLRPGDFGLDTTLKDIPQKASGLPITITGVDLTLKGKVGSPPQGFLRNPTSCGSHTLSVDATPYSGSPGSGSATFNTDSCQALPFSPKFSAEITKLGDSTVPVEVSTSIKQTIEEAGLKRATVTLPSDLGPNGSAFANTCAEADFQASTCPEASIVGSARAASPLQSEALRGPVVLITAAPGTLPMLGLDLSGPLALKLRGAIGLDASNPSAVRSQVTFDGLPDIPISDFTLTFDGGDGGLNLATRSPCDPPPFRFDTTFLSHAGGTVSGPTDAEGICGSSAGKEPQATLKLRNPKRGDPALRLRVRSGAARIRSAKLKLPKGVAFGHGRAFKRGAKVKADGAKLKAKAGKRSLKLKARSRGAARIKARFSHGAVRVKGNGRVRKRFELVVRDVDGTRTKLRLRAK